MYTLPQENIISDQISKEIYVSVNWQRYDVAFFTSRSDLLKWAVGDETNEYAVYRYDMVSKQTEPIPAWELKEMSNVEKK